MIRIVTSESLIRERRGIGHVSEVSAKKQHASLGLGGGFKHFFFLIFTPILGETIQPTKNPEEKNTCFFEASRKTMKLKFLRESGSKKFQVPQGRPWKLSDRSKKTLSAIFN